MKIDPRTWSPFRSDWSGVLEPEAVKELPAPRVETKEARVGDSAYVGSPGRPEPVIWPERSASQQQLKASTWVYVGTTRLARAVGSIPLRVERLRGDRWQAVTERHPLQDLLDYPNKLMGWSSLAERMVYQLTLAGNSPVYKVRAGGRPVELWPLPPDQTRPVPHPTEILAGYRYKPSRGSAQAIAVEDMVWLMYTDPENLLVGLSPLQVAVRAIRSEIRMSEWQDNSMDRRNVPDLVIGLKAPLSEMQRSALDAKMLANSGPDNARRAMIIGSDVSVTPTGLTAAELDFILSRKMSREEILAILGVPPPTVGIYEDATYNNVATAHLRFYEDTVLPLSGMIAQTLTMQLSTDYGPDLRIVPDDSQVRALREAVAMRADTATKYWAMGVSFAEINRRLDLGFEETEDHAVAYIPAGVVPASDVLAGGMESEQASWDGWDALDDAIGRLGSLADQLH